VRKYALEQMPKVCRTGTHLLHFAAFLDAERAWGRMVRRAFTAWFTGRCPEALARQVTKYPSRDGWSMRDVIRSAHPKAPSPAYEAIFRYITGGIDATAGRAVTIRDRKTVTYPSVRAALPKHIEVVEEIKSYGGRELTRTEASRLAATVVEHRLEREMLPTEALNHGEIWEALLTNMKPNACIRNLGVMTAKGVIAPLSEGTKRVIEILSNSTLLREERVHPLSVLIALKTYTSGRGLKGSLTWTPNPQITSTLDDAFYTTFQFVQPTGRAHYLAVDVSASMTWHQIAGIPLTPREASAAMAMVTARCEPRSQIFAFSDTMVETNVTASDSLATVIRKFEAVRMGSTDCALPFIDAMNRNIPAEVFVVYTDSETNNRRNGHPAAKLKAFRERSGIPAKSIVVGMEASNISIADPNDPGMLDIVGFSTDAPLVMASFART
jgi:60 kDa SS-A/Ro ribonucleoprotein